MRRITVVLVLLAGLVFAAGPSASAHTCGVPLWIQPGQAATVTVGVPAEQLPAFRVDVTVPSGFVLDRVIARNGWTSARHGPVVTFTGGIIDAYGCAYFRLAGTAPRKAMLAFPLSVHSPGSVRRYTSHQLGDPYSAQLVYAGTTSYLRADRGGIDVGRVIQITALSVSGLLVAGWLYRRSRRPLHVSHG